MTAGRPAVCFLAASLCAGTAGAQRSVRPAIVAAHVDHRVEAGFGPEHASGLVFGGEIRLGVYGSAAVTVSGSAGHLRARAGQAIDRDLAQLSVRAEALPLAWLALDAGFTRRSYSTVLARQRWTLWGVGAEARVPFSGGRVHALGRFGLYPRASVNGLPRANLAVESAVGMSYTSGPWGLELRYSFERCDFPATTGVERIEQLSGLTLRAGRSMAR